MNNTILQIPVDKEIRDQARRRVSAMGFSSLQEAIRILLGQIASGSLRVEWQAEEPELSSKAAARYDKMYNDYISGKVKAKSYTNVDELMKDLNS